MVREVSGATRAEVSLRAHRAAGTFSRTVAEGTGTNVIAGLGFTPSVIMFTAYGATAGAAHVPICWSYATATGEVCIYFQGNSAVQGYAGVVAIYIFLAAANTWSGTVSAYGADGFSVTLTLVGNPGTVVVNWVALE